MEDSPALWIVASNMNAPASEAQINRWYDEVQIPRVLRARGIVAATRYAALKPRPRQPKYITFYDLESEEVVDSLQGLPELAEGREDWERNWAPRGGEIKFGWYYSFLNRFTR